MHHETGTWHGRPSAATIEPPGTRGSYFPLPPIIYHTALHPRRAFEEIRLGTLQDGRLRVVTPIVVRCMVDAGTVTAEAPELCEFGYGRTASEAVRDLQRTLVELYWTLDTEQGRLGPDLQAVWGILQQRLVVERRN